MHNTHRSIACALCTVLLSVAGAGADTARLTRDELLNRLQTRQAQLALDSAESEKDRSQVELNEIQRLYNDKVVTVEELNMAQQTYQQATLNHEQAKIELEKTRLEFLGDATLVTVKDARKFRTEDGRFLVAIKIGNDSDLDKAKTAISEEGEDAQAEAEALLTIDQLVVSLHHPQDAKTIVGDPFQQIIKDFVLGAEKELTFELLVKDLDSVSIGMEYLDEKKAYSVFLKKDALQDLPTITSTQYAQEGRLESKIRYDLVLERLSKTEQSFIPVVLNLPRSISYAFLDPASGARITQLKFNEELTKQTLDFELSIPKNLDKSLIDANVNMTILVIRKADLKNVHKIIEQYGGEDIPAEAFAEIKANKVELILIPKGVGKLDILIANLYKEVRQGEDVEFKLSILNSGTLELRNIQPEIDLPLDWEGTLEPKEVKVVAPGEKVKFQARLIPALDVSVGEYSINIEAVGHSGYEKIEATRKNYTVRLAAKTNLTGTLLLVTVLIVLVLGIAIASVKISRR